MLLLTWSTWRSIVSIRLSYVAPEIEEVVVGRSWRPLAEASKCSMLR